jgi:nitrilase
VLADTPVGRLGLSVCYDMRFPELYRELVSRGAEWLAMPAAFTVPTGRAHWETLLRARAIENLCYVVAPAQWGTHSSGRETYGDSLIVDYWGQVLARLADGTGVISADFDLGQQGESRARFPALDNRRLGVAQSRSQAVSA